MDVKRVIAMVILLSICSLSYAQERVIVDRDYYKNEYIDDKTASNKEYFGWSYPGASYSDSVWRICRLTYTGTTFVVEWASGDHEFTHKMSEYELLTYE